LDYFGALPRPEDAIPIARHFAMAVMGCLLKMRTKSLENRVLKIEIRLLREVHFVRRSASVMLTMRVVALSIFI
jgi:hypothetical protein